MTNRVAHTGSNGFQETVRGIETVAIDVNIGSRIVINYDPKKPSDDKWVIQVDGVEQTEVSRILLELDINQGACPKLTIDRIIPMKLM